MPQNTCKKIQDIIFYYYCYFSYYYGNEMYTVYQVYVYIWCLLHSRWNWLSYKTIITVLIRSYVCCNYLYNPWLWHRVLRLHYRDRIWDFKKEGFGGNCKLIWGFNCMCPLILWHGINSMRTVCVCAWNGILPMRKTSIIVLQFCSWI